MKSLPARDCDFPGAAYLRVGAAHWDELGSRRNEGKGWDITTDSWNVPRDILVPFPVLPTSQIIPLGDVLGSWEAMD